MARALDTVHRFVDALVPADTASIGSFGGGVGVAVSPHLTSDHSVLHRVVNEEIWPIAGPASAPPWAGIDRAMSALQSRSGVRVVLVLSSGDEGGVVTDLRARAAREDVMIYGVLFEGTMLDRLHKGACPAGEFCASRDGTSWLHFIGSPPGTVLNPLAELTGGGHFTIHESDDLAAIMTDLAEELRRQYVLGFTPPTLDGKAHDIRVQTVPSGLTVRARNSYIAGPSR
jgi:VWFA-related protein